MHKVEELEPKAQSLDLISADKAALPITQVAKCLGIEKISLRDCMHTAGCIGKRVRELLTTNTSKTDAYNSKKQPTPMI